MAGLRRLTAVSGIASVVLVSVGLFGGTPPAADDSGRAVLHYAADHRTFVLVYFTVFGLATCVTLLFFAGLRRVLATPEPERDVWASAMFASAVAVFTLGIAGQACMATLAYRAPTPTPEAARTTWDLSLVLIGASNLLTIILGVAAAIAIAQSRALPGWLATAAGVFAVAHFGATVSWARSGALSPTGVFSILAPILYLAWVLAVSVVLLRERHPTSNMKPTP